MDALVGIGLYTPLEASRLLRLPASKITRWLKGHTTKKKTYDRLWEPEISLGDERVFLGFRDLMELRVADVFIREGISAQKIRRAIDLARAVIGQDHPLATNRFRTDGREIFLQLSKTDENDRSEERLLNLFRNQFEFQGVIEPILKTVDFGEDGSPLLWWPCGRSSRIVVDPARAFGQPLDSSSSVPTVVLASAAVQEGVKRAARVYEVSEAAIKRALRFEAFLERRLAA